METAVLEQETEVRSQKPGESGRAVRHHDTALIARVKALGLSNRALSDALGMSSAVISTWLNGSYKGDVTGLEGRVLAYLDTLALQEAAPQVESGFLDTRVAQRLFGSLERIWETLDLGIVTGPAGAGKTQGCLKYRELKPTAIYICILPWMRDDWAVTRLLVRAISQRRDDRRDMDWVCDKLTGSKRLLIVDDAHELSGSGYKLLIKLQDVTGMAVALVGNEVMVEDIRGHTVHARRRSSQMVSRVGVRLALETYDRKGDQKPLYPAADVAALVAQHLESPSKELLALCEWAANLPGQGHFRTLHKVLKNTAKFLQSTDDDIVAFQKSWAMLRSDVVLPEFE